MLFLIRLLGGADPGRPLIRNGLLDELKKALAERALNAEMDHHLGNGDGSSRSGYGKKTTQIVLDVREIGSLASIRT
jgi:putative transposase